MLLLVDHREDLAAERTRIIGRLRWHLHERDPGWLLPAKLERHSAFDKVQAHLSARDHGVLVRRLALRLAEHLWRLTDEIDDLTAEISERVNVIAPSLPAIVGCGAPTGAKIIGETADVSRFRSKDVFARHNGTAALPVWSSNKQRHRLSRMGNRQLNAALHRIALTQARFYPPARDLLDRAQTAATAVWSPTHPQRATLRRRLPRGSPTMLADHPLLLDRGARDSPPDRSGDKAHVGWQAVTRY